MNKLVPQQNSHIDEGIPLFGAKYEEKQSTGATGVDQFISQLIYQHTLSYIDNGYGAPNYPDDDPKLREEFSKLLNTLGITSSGGEKMANLFNTATQTIVNSTFRLASQ